MMGLVRDGKQVVEGDRHTLGGEEVEEFVYRAYVDSDCIASH